MSERVRVVVVDDEPPARALLREFLAQHADVEVVGECTNGFEAVQRIGEVQPDLVLLDVQMPKLDGFEVLALLDPGPQVVFVTAYDEYALRAFEVNAVDYLLKPFGRERLAEALGRVRVRLGRSTGAAAAPATQAAPHAVATPGVPALAASPAALAAALQASARDAGRYTERLLVKDRGQVHVIPIERIDYLESQDDYVAIHAGGTVHLKTQPLSEVAAGLDPSRFVRVHRSYVVHIDRIARLELYAKDSRVAILHDGREVPVSRSGYERLQALLR
jgi:two-component system LytT family response regulator